MNELEDLKLRLELARRAKRLTQKQLANKLGVNQERISWYENVTPTQPNFPLLKRIAKELDVNLAWLLCNEGPRKRTKERSENLSIAA